MRHKKYPYYIFHKPTDKVLAGYDYREDAVEMLSDMPYPKGELAVKTHAWVERTVGKVSWVATGERKNPRKLASMADIQNSSALVWRMLADYEQGRGIDPAAQRRLSEGDQRVLTDGIREVEDKRALAEEAARDAHRSRPYFREAPAQARFYEGRILRRQEDDESGWG